MLSSPSTSKLLSLRDVLMHLRRQGIDVDEALDHLRVDLRESEKDSPEWFR